MSVTALVLLCLHKTGAQSLFTNISLCKSIFIVDPCFEGYKKCRRSKPHFIIFAAEVYTFIEVCAFEELNAQNFNKEI